MTKAQKEQDIADLEKMIAMDKAIIKNFPDNVKFKEGLELKEKKLEELKATETED